jgi:hypothetical protein
MKVVINACHGGFGLSEKAVVRLFELKGKPVWPEKTSYGFNNYYVVPSEKRVTKIPDKDFYDLPMDKRQEYNEACSNETFDERGIYRADPLLVQVVEELGEEAGGRFASLKIVEIPDDVEWEVEEYDGDEWVSEKRRTWR